MEGANRHGQLAAAAGRRLAEIDGTRVDAGRPAPPTRRAKAAIRLYDPSDLHRAIVLNNGH